jgi:hypothetical protein
MRSRCLPCSKTLLKLDTSDEGSIIDRDEEGVVSDKEGSGIEEGEDSDGDTRSTMMPTSMNCPSMDCHDASTLASTSHLSTNYDDTLLTGPSINSHDTSMLESIIHPFIDNHDTSTTTHPSIESHSAAAIHPSVAGNTHIPTTIRPSINSHDSGSDVQPFCFASELTCAG